MRRFFYLAGRAFQVAGLMTLPSAIWIGQFEHDERGAIAVLAASVAVFYLGHLMNRASRRTG